MLRAEIDSSGVLGVHLEQVHVGALHNPEPVTSSGGTATLDTTFQSVEY
jgi:hypothetical protein